MYINDIEKYRYIINNNELIEYIRSPQRSKFQLFFYYHKNP